MTGRRPRESSRRLESEHYTPNKRRRDLLSLGIYGLEAPPLEQRVHADNAAEQVRALSQVRRQLEAVTPGEAGLESA